MRCNGHPAGPHDSMGVTVYCDGSCRPFKPGEVVAIDEEGTEGVVLEVLGDRVLIAPPDDDFECGLWFGRACLEALQ